ncbi:MAG TPA: ABC transporter permease subunit [Anaerolineae bacterium]|nr:ABC transporter permease subunit [Anaerolineae bacterium]
MILGQDVKVGKLPAPQARPQRRGWPERLKLVLMLAPALAVIGLLFLGGLALAVMQSLGYLPFLGRTELSLEAYRHIFGREDFFRSLFLSLWISLVATGVSTGLAVIAALILRRQFRGRRWATFIFQLNIPIPHLVGAVGILFLFSQSGFLARLAHLAHFIDSPAGFPALVFDPLAVGIILQYIWKSTTFIGVIVLAVMQSVGEDYEQVAQSLGANRWQRFRYVLLPLIMPGILSASTLVFAFTFGAFEVPLLLGQRYPSALPVLAYRYYTDADLNFRPEAMAVSVFVSLAVTLLIFVYFKLSQKVAS